MLTVGGVFDGIGLLAYGLTLAGLEHRWLCEVDPWRRDILARRWPGVPVYNDVRAVGVAAERVGVIAGGFPCKGASSSGKREGFGHPETVLWREMARAIRELRPRYVVVENVADILGLHDGAVWAEVVGDLATCGYGVEWDCFPAAAFGAPHLRDRVIAIAADSDSLARSPQLARDGRSSPMDESGSVERTERLPRAPAALADSARRSEGCDAAQAARRLATEPDGAFAVVAESGIGGQPEQSPEHGTESARPNAHPERCGVRVEWGPYGAAIRRWEAIRGPAPEPLVRGVDDGAAARLVRSRLSALGDGVQVQLGELVGRYLIELEEGRLAA